MHAIDIYGLSRGDRPRRGRRVHREQGRTAHLGGPLLPGDRRPGHRRRAARGRVRRAGLHLADQGGDAGGPLPDPGPDPAAARHRPADAPDREDHRPQRRHDHPARGEPVPHPDRGTASCGCPRCPRTSSASWTGRADGRDDRAGRTPGRRRPRRRRGRRSSWPSWSRTRSGSLWRSTSSRPAGSNAPSARCGGSSISGRARIRGCDGHRRDHPAVPGRADRCGRSAGVRSPARCWSGSTRRLRLRGRLERRLLRHRVRGQHPLHPAHRSPASWSKCTPGWCTPADRACTSRSRSSAADPQRGRVHRGHRTARSSSWPSAPTGGPFRCRPGCR